MSLLNTAYWKQDAFSNCLFSSINFPVLIKSDGQCIYKLGIVNSATDIIKKLKFMLVAKVVSFQNDSIQDIVTSLYHYTSHG